MKLTKRQMFEQIRAHLTDGDEIDFINHELELLDRKNANKSDKPTKKQVENANIKNAIYDAMEVDKKYRVTEIVELSPSLSSHRAVALLTQMKDSGMIDRELIKGIAYFVKRA